MQLKNKILGLVVLSLLTGCSYFKSRDQVDYQAGAGQVPALELPPGLSGPVDDGRYAIPEPTEEQVTSYTEYMRQQQQSNSGNNCACGSEGTEVGVVNSAVVDARPIEPAKPATIVELNKEKHIMYVEPFDRSWLRVGMVLDRLRIKVTDKDRSNGTYFIETMGAESQLRVHHVTVKETSDGTRIAIVNERGEYAPEMERILEVMGHNLNTPDNSDKK